MRKAKSVDSVLQNMSKAIDQLEEVGNTNQQEAGRLANQIENLEAKKDSATKEADRAERVREKLADLLS